MTKYEIILYWSGEDEAFIAEVPELAGCAADGPTRQEALAITEYLVQTATAQTIKYPISSDLKGDKKAGHDLFTTLGCMACHSNLNENGEDWITTDLVKGKGMKADEAKRLKELERENARLKKLLAEAELEKAMLKELAEGNF